MISYEEGCDLSGVGIYFSRCRIEFSIYCRYGEEKMNYISYTYWQSVERKEYEAMVQLCEGKLSMVEYVKVYADFLRNEEELCLFPKNKTEFVQIMGYQSFYTSPEKEWEHEMEHYSLILEEGLKPRIAIVFLKNDINDKPPITFRKTFTVDNRHEIIGQLRIF